MNKKLLAFAVAAAFAAPMVANADSGNVTIYGQANASIDRVNPGTGAAALNDDAWRVSSNSSRLGFKGTEALGNGLSAVWQMETGVSLDSGSTASDFMMRNSFVGLSSGTMGTAILGRHDTPYKLGTASLDPFADTMGDYNAIVGNIGGTVAFDSRLGNVMAYISPTWSGFHFAAAAVMANETNNTANKDGSAYSLTGVYANGPIFASLSYEQAKDITGSTTNAAPAALGGVLATLEKARGTKLGLGYNAGVAKVNFVYEQIKVNAAGASDNTRNAYYLSGTVPMGKIALNAAYGRTGDISNNTVDNDGASQITIGADYSFSKRTVAYALYSRMDNKNNGGYGLGGNGAGGAFAPAAAGQDPSVFSLGMKHSF